MIYITDPLGNGVLLTGSIFDQPFDPTLPKLHLSDFKDVIASPDVMIDHESDMDFIYYPKTMDEGVRILISAYPMGDHYLAFACIMNPAKEYEHEITQGGFVLNFTQAMKKGLIARGVECQ